MFEFLSGIFWKTLRAQGTLVNIFCSSFKRVSKIHTFKFIYWVRLCCFCSAKQTFFLFLVSNPIIAQRLSCDPSRTP